MGPTEPKNNRRTLFIGAPGSPHRRVRLDVLESLIKRLSNVVDAVAKDLGLRPEETPQVELVDLIDGSSGLVFEQAAPAGKTKIPLGLAMDAIAARAAGRPLPKLLTDSVVRSVDEFGLSCAEFKRQNIPIRVEATPPGRPESPTALYAASSILPPLVYSLENKANEIASVADSAGSYGANGSNGEPIPEQGEWILKFSGKGEKLDEKARRLWVRSAGTLVSIDLDEEKFAAADKDDARWKQVLVTARSSSPVLQGNMEALDITPTSSNVNFEATPINDAATGLRPLLDRIEGFCKLKAEWDSYPSSVPIAATAIRAAKHFVALAAADAVARGVMPVLPFAAPVARGSVQLEWESDAFYLELEFVDHRQIAFLRSVGDETSEGPATRARALELVAWFEENCTP